MYIAGTLQKIVHHREILSICKSRSKRSKPHQERSAVAAHFCCGNAHNYLKLEKILISFL